MAPEEINLLQSTIYKDNQNKQNKHSYQIWRRLNKIYLQLPASIIDILCFDYNIQSYCDREQHEEAESIKVVPQRGEGEGGEIAFSSTERRGCLGRSKYLAIQGENAD